MVFRPMLADNKPFNQVAVEKHLQECGFLIMEPKIDGMRALIDEATIPRTRSGKEHKNRYLRKWASQHPSLRGIDGEVASGHQMSVDTFRESMSGIRAEEGSPEFTFYAFDYFMEPWCDAFNYERRRILEERLEALGTDQIGDDYHAKLILVPQLLVHNIDEIRAEEERLLVAGWEGAMLRRPDRPYKFNRSTWNGGELMKVKRYEDDEAVITGCYAWEANNNEAVTDVRGYTTRSAHQDNKDTLERLGGFHCHLLRDPSVQFDIGVFRGWGHADRDALWNQRDSLIGRILKFKHQGYGGGYDRPRTPVGLGFRDAWDL